jgi:hypothetical protein
MNAAILTKSAKGLILASGLIAASSILGYAQDAPVALGAQATVPLSALYMSAPSGITTLGGHTFDLSGGNLIQLGNGKSASFSGSWKKAQAAYLLLNTYNTYWWYDQSVVGNVTLTFSDGTTQSTDLTVGGNVREWRIGSGFTVGTLSDPATTTVWTGSAQQTMGGGTAVIDMLTITLPGTKTLTSISVNDTNGWGALSIDLAGLTVDDNPFTWPGQSGTIGQAAQHSQAPQHSKSAIFTGQSPSQGQSTNSANAGMNTPATSGTNPAH